MSDVQCGAAGSLGCELVMRGGDLEGFRELFVKEWNVRYCSTTLPAGGEAAVPVDEERPCSPTSQEAVIKLRLK
jgi:hypothetical protein